METIQEPSTRSYEFRDTLRAYVAGSKEYNAAYYKLIKGSIAVKGKKERDAVIASGKYRCDEHDKNFRSQCHLDKHNVGFMHGKKRKVKTTYTCECCNYSTPQIGHFNRHEKTRRHKYYARINQ